MEIVLASAQTDLRVALEILLREEPGMDVVGTASEAASLRALLQASRPGLVLLDWDLPGHPPASLVAKAKSLVPQPKVIVLSIDPALKEVALASGADAFFVKGDSPRPMLAAIREAQPLRSAAAKQIPAEAKGE